LKNESERRACDPIYPSLKAKTRSSQYTQHANTTPNPTPQSGTLSEAAQISALQKSRQERAARWRISSRTFESSIFEISRVIRRLEQDIKNLDSIFAAEVAVEAQKNSWKAWLLSPLYKKAEESSEEKALKDRARQERRIEKDMKERRLDVQKAELKAIETSIRTAESKMKAGDSRDEATIQNILYNLRLKEERERERLARERVAQQMKQQQEQLEKRRQQQAAKQAADRARYEEYNRRRQKIFEEEVERQRQRYAYFNHAEQNNPQTRRATCRHDGWWPKVQGRTACPECSESWTYLLQCPGCDMKACPRCQAAVRPKRPRGAPQRIRTPSPDNSYDYDW
jgi:hypothetical protein